MKEALEKMHQHFSAQEKLREQLLENSRHVIRHSARAIAAMHRGDSTADELLAKAREGLTALGEAIKSEPHLAESGMILAAYQEYCEAALLKAIIERGEILKPDDIGVPYKPYLAALADATGELRRRALDLIRGDEVTAAEKVLRLMEEIFELLMSFDYPDAILPGMRRRQDMVRRMLERTRGDLTMAIRQQKLESALKRAERAGSG
jgi:translin